MAPIFAARERWNFHLVLERASEALRQEGARNLWFKILAQTMYRGVLLLERPLQEPIPEVTARVPVVISLLKTTEIAEYVQFPTEADVSGVQSRLNTGQVCFVARHQGGLVSTSWAAINRAWLDYLSPELRLASDEVFAYDTFTEPAFRQPAAFEPAPIDLAKLGVAIAGGLLLEVLEVQQFEGDPGLPPLGVQVGAVGHSPMVGGRGRGPVHPGLQCLIGQGLDLAPVKAGPPGPAFDGGHGAQADPQPLRHLTVGPAQGPLLPQDLANLPHG